MMINSDISGIKSHDRERRYETKSDLNQSIKEVS